VSGGRRGAVAGRGAGEGGGGNPGGRGAEATALASGGGRARCVVSTRRGRVCLVAGPGRNQTGTTGTGRARTAESERRDGGRATRPLRGGPSGGRRGRCSD